MTLEYIKENIGKISSVTNMIIFIIIAILCIVVYVLKELNNSSEDIVKNLLDKCYYISLAVISICFILIPLVIRIIETGITIYHEFKNMKNSRFNFNNIISNSKKDSGAIDKTFIENIINGLVSVALNYLHIFITLIGLVLVYNFVGESDFFNVSLFTLMAIIFTLFAIYVTSNILNFDDKSLKNLLNIIFILMLVLSSLNIFYQIFLYIVNLTTKFNKFVKEHNWWNIFSYIFTILVMILISGIVIIFNYFKLELSTMLGNIEYKIKSGEDRILNKLDNSIITKKIYKYIKIFLKFLDDMVNKNKLRTSVKNI